MKNKRVFKTLSALCAALVLMGGFSVTAFAQGTEQPPAEDATNDENVVVEEAEDSPALTPEGNAALVDDFGGNKQLITVTTKAGNYFYILIDRASEDKETAVHFLNQVDEADLMALMEDGQSTEKPPAVCNCTEKCEAGEVNTKCEVCSTDMTGCTGKEPEPETPAEPAEPEKKESAGLNPAVLLLVLAVMGGADFVPLAAVILVERLIFTGSPPAVFHIESGGWDLLLCQIYGDLIAVLPTDKQTENQTDNLGGFFVDYPKILVVRVFDIAVRGFGDNRLSTHAFGLNARFHFLADVLCIPLRHDIDKGRKLQCVGLLAVNAVVDRDKAHIVPSEYLHRVADLEIVAPPAGKVFHNADTDFPVFHIVHHAGVGGTVKKPAAFVIVDVVPDIG